MESIVRNKIIQIENRAARMISDLRNNENKSTALIRDEERLLLEMIGKNPRKWTSKTLEFNIMSSETETSPSVHVEILRSSVYELRSELRVMDEINPLGYKTVGQVNCYGNFELSFDLVFNGFNCLLEIGEWFGLRFNKNGTCSLRLNDLYNDKKYHEITSENFLNNLHNWYKEYSTLFLTAKIVKNSECLSLTSS